MQGNYDAIYHYSVKDFRNDNLIRQHARCLIIGETERSYKIRLTEATWNGWPGEEIWVRKRSISRSYYNNETECCDIYQLKPAEQSCCACIQNCLRKWDLIRKVNTEKDERRK